MDPKYLKSSDALDRENRELRGILRRLIELDAGQNIEQDLSALQAEARSTLDRMDGRKAAAGFTRPEVQGKVQAKAREQQAAFLKEVGPVLRELKAGSLSLRSMADALNERGIAAPAGGKWAPGSVKYQLDAMFRLEAESP